MAGQDRMEADPIVRALERSTIAQTLKAARASLAEPSRPFTPLDRSLFQLPDGASPSRPSSSYSVDQLQFGFREHGGGGGGSLGRSESARSSRSSRGAGRPDTIAEEEGYSREGGADVLRLDGSRRAGARRQPSRGAEVAGDSSGSEELTPITAAAPSPPPRTPARPPRPPPGGGYPPVPAMVPTTSERALIRSGSSGGYPDASGVPSSPSRHKAGASSPHRSSRRSSSGSSRRKASASPAPSPPDAASAPSGGGAPSTPRRRWDREAEAFLASVQEWVASKERRRQGGEQLVDILTRIWALVADLRAGKGSEPALLAARLLREAMSLMDLKEVKEDPKCLFKLSRSALALLRMEGSTEGFPTSGVQSAYLNIAQGLFKYSQRGEHDSGFREEELLEPLLEVLESSAPECASNDLRVYVVGVLKNVSNDEANQRVLAEGGVVAALFRLMAADQLTGSSKEAQLLIQATAALRNLAGKQHEQFLVEDRLDALTRVMALFPVHVELLTNVSRILAKLTLHASACEAFARTSTHLRQIARTLSANPDSAPLTLRLAFVLGNLTERSDRLRVVFAFDCEGTALVPQLLCKYWQKERQLARVEQGQVNGAKEVEEVLVKLVRLVANIAISATAGATLASSSAVVDPLLDMLGAKRISDSEELVLNVVAAVTNLLFYDVPSNLLFQEDNKQLLCRLFRPLLLESYNVEALVETARALGNLSRHADARRCMSGLRIDEILVILLDHDDRDLVFYVCGALVNLGADAECTVRLMTASPIARKLGKLLGDAPADDPALRLVAVKVLTNLSLDPSVAWSGGDVEAVRENLSRVAADCEEAEAELADASADGQPDAAEWQQLLDLSRQLLARLPPPPEPGEASPPADAPAVQEQPRQERVFSGHAGGDGASGGEWACRAAGCSRRFPSEAKMLAHMERRHPAGA